MGKFDPVVEKDNDIKTQHHRLLYECVNCSEISDSCICNNISMIFVKYWLIQH